MDGERDGQMDGWMDGKMGKCIFSYTRIFQAACVSNTEAGLNKKCDEQMMD